MHCIVHKQLLKSPFIQTFCLNNLYYMISIGGVIINMTEDHRIVSPSERTRLKEEGLVLKDGETRLCGDSLHLFSFH